MNNFYPLYDEGKLDSQSEMILKQIAESNSIPLTSQTPQQARDSFLEKEWLGVADKSVQMKNMVAEYSGNYVPIRVYTPKGSGPFPVLIYFHGGGFVLGNLDEFDPFCTFLSSGAGCIVVSVDYRLAPENKFPAAVDDMKLILKWIGANAAKINGDENRIAVSGDSAGANLAAVASIISRDEKYPSIIYQVLICPWVDLSSTDTGSYKYFGNGLWLSTENIYWYRNHYLQSDEQANSFLVSPLLAESFKGLPPALIISSEFDVLRDEAEAYANRLRTESIPVQYSNYKGMLHGFVILPGLFDKAKEAIDEICRCLRKVFHD